MTEHHFHLKYLPLKKNAPGFVAGMLS